MSETVFRAAKYIRLSYADDKDGESALENEIKDFIKKRDSKPGAVFLGVVHRIDRPVSGAVVFAKTSKALVRLNEMIRRGEFDKRYKARQKELVAGGMSEEEAKKNAPIIQYVFEQYASGVTKKHIMEELNSRGVLNYNGKPLTYSCLQNALKNPKYIGKYTFGGAEVPHVEGGVRVHNPDQRDVREVKPLGYHLRAYENLRLARGEAAD